MKKTYIVEFYTEGQYDNSYKEKIRASDIDEVKAIITNSGYLVKTINEDNSHILSTLKEKLAKNISFSRGYDEKKEIILLKGIATGMSNGIRSNSEVFKYAKAEFSKVDVAMRKHIDDLMFYSKQPGITHTADILLKKSEIFSPDLIILLEQSKNANIEISKIISNQSNGNSEIDGYCELKEKVIDLKEEIIGKAKKPIMYFSGLLTVSYVLLTYGVPKFLEVFSKQRDISQDNYYGIGESVIAVSKFFNMFGFWILLILFGLLTAGVYLYNTSFEFKRSTHRYILKMPVVGDILTLFTTRKVVSLMAVFYQTGMRPYNVLDLVSKTVYLIPIKEELNYIKEKSKTLDYETIFNSYSEDEQYLTEMFYLQLARQSNSSSSGVTGLFSQAFNYILNNTHTQWKNSLSRYPDKIALWINIVGFGVVIYTIMGLLLIYGLTVVNSANNV